MDVWVWIVLYVLVFALFQLLVYRYFHDDDGASVSNPSGDPSQFGRPQDGHRLPRSAERTADDGQSDDSGSDDGASVRRCPHCGTENDRSFTYCRNCVSPLSM